MRKIINFPMNSTILNLLIITNNFAVHSYKFSTYMIP